MRNLYKLLIVDDEIIICNGLKSFPWEKLGYQVVGTASDGKEALVIFGKSHVDVVISDIKMPIMDGLELSRIISCDYPECKIILLTGHKDFEYAKSAIHFGIYEYIIKPVDIDELEQLMLALKTHLDNEYANSQVLAGYEKKLRGSLPYAIKYFLKELVEGKISNYEEIDEKLNLLEISINKFYYACINIQICNEHTTGSSDTSLDTVHCFELISEYLIMTGFNYMFIKGESELIVILNFDLEDNISTYEYLTNYINTFHDNIGNETCKFCIGVGNIYNNVLMLPSSYLQASLALKRRFFDNKTFIYYSWKEKSALPTGITEYPFDIEKRILNAILIGDRNLCESSLKAFNDNYSVYLNQMDSDQVKNNYFRLLNTLSIELNKLSISLCGILKINSSISDFINSKNTLKSLQDSIIKAIYAATDSIIENSNKIKTSSYSVISQAIKYIEEHYNEKITLNAIASIVHFNPSYFSIQFKKETTKNFIDYLRSYRIEQAKEFLKSNELKIYEISSMVGYQDPKYFIETFKCLCGVTPLEYKQRIIPMYKEE